MMAFLLPLLEKFGKWIVIVGVIVGLFFWGRHYQLDSRLKETQLSEAQQTIQQVQSDYAKYQAQQLILSQEQKAQENKTVSIVRTISNDKDTSECVKSPAIIDVLTGLHDDNTSTVTANTPGKHADVQKRTRRTRKSHR